MPCTGPIDSSFSDVVVDFSSGNVHAAGMQADGTSTYGGASVSGEGPLLVKYTSGGTGTWARSVAGGGETGFSGVAVDSTGNVYCAGEVFGDSTYDFGGATAAGDGASSNAVVVKYDAAGAAVRARSVSVGPASSRFIAVAAVPGGDVFAVGVQMGSSAYTYGTGVSVAGYNTNEHSVVVKYSR